MHLHWTRLLRSLCAYLRCDARCSIAAASVAEEARGRCRLPESDANSRSEHRHDPNCLVGSNWGLEKKPTRTGGRYGGDAKWGSPVATASASQSLEYLWRRCAPALGVSLIFVAERPSNLQPICAIRIPWSWPQLHRVRLGFSGPESMIPCPCKTRTQSSLELKNYVP